MLKNKVKNLKVKKAMLAMIMASYTFIVGFNDNTEREEYFAKVDLPLREEVLEDSKVIDTIVEFDIMELIYEDDDYFYVSYNDKCGFIDKKDVELIEGDYVEVDISDQRLIYNQNGDIRIDTDVVTGHAGVHDTPVGSYELFDKKQKVVLRGPGYASPVDNWMPFIKKRGIGFHDAKWRDEFGGEIYLTKGSHGCVNMPYDAATKLREEIEVGTKVLIHK